MACLVPTNCIGKEMDLVASAGQEENTGIRHASGELLFKLYYINIVYTNHLDIPLFFKII
jgi:hypothetical protein